MTEKVLIITFECGEIVHGGIGTSLNNLSKSFDSKIHCSFARLEWDNTKNYFILNYISASKQIIKLNGSFSESIRYLNRMGYRRFHFHHVSKAVLEIIKILKTDKDNIIYYTCHSLFAHDYRVRGFSEADIYEEEEILSSSHCIQVLNKLGLDLLKYNYPSLAAPIHIIPNRVDTASASKRILYCQKQYKIVCVSRWTKGKGIEKLINAIEFFLKRDSDIVFELVGRPNHFWRREDEEYANKIDSLIDTIGSERIVVRSWINREQLDEIIINSSVALIPSEFEYFPYSFIEPAFLGTPVVANHLDCLREIGVEGRDFVEAKFDEPIEFYEKIKRLLTDYSHYKHIQENALKLILDVCNDDKFIKDYRNFYGF